MNVAPCPFSVVVVLIWLAVAPSLAKAQDRERTFAAMKCSYRLPNDDWSWSEDKMPNNTLFIAANKDGFVATLSYMTMSRSNLLDQDFVNDFESTFYKKAQMTKRGGQFINFLGRPCYQAEGVLADGRTVINRTLLSPDCSYNFAVIGGNQPVESAPEFEAIVNGLTLTAPLVQKEALNQLPAEEPPNVSRRLGEIAGYCIVGVVIVAVCGWFFQKKKS